MSYLRIDQENLTVFTPTKGSPFTVTDERLRDIIYSYVHGGENLSQDQVSAKYDLPLVNLRFLLRALTPEISKASPPILPFDVLVKSKEELEEELLRRKVSEFNKNSVPRKVITERNALARTVEELKHKLFHVEEISSSLASMPTFDRYSELPTVSPVSDAAATLMCLSDWHGGATCSSDGKYLGFNKDIFWDRINQILNYIKSMKVKGSLYLLFLGDLLDDVLSQMHKSQQILQDARGGDQLDMVGQACAMIIQEALRVSRSKVYVLSLGGNHDRATKHRDDDLFKTFHQVLFQRVQSLVAPAINAGLLTIHTSLDSWKGFSPTPNVRILATHGDSRFKPQEIIQSDGMSNKGYKLVVQGHLHTRRYQELTGGSHLIVPSLMGGSHFSHNILGKSSVPGQAVVYIHEREGVPYVNPQFIDLY